MKVNLLFIVWILLFSAGCGDTYQGMEALEAPTEREGGFKSVFYGFEQAFAYDTGVRFRSNYVSGLLFIKPEGEEEYRIAMTTKMGQKIFDFSLDKENFTVNYCVPQLNRKIVLSLLEKDLHLITDSFLEPETLAVFKDELPKTVYRIKNQKDYLHYHYDDTSEQLVRIERGAKRKPKITATLSDYQDGIPHQIHLDHRLLFKLELDLKWFELNK